MTWGGWAVGVPTALYISFAFTSAAAPPVASGSAAADSIATAEPAPPAESAASAQTTPSAPSTLPVGSPIIVILDQDLSTMTAQLGDRFPVIVLHDVVDQDTVIIPKGTPGHGEVTYASGKGAFGRPGVIGITLRHLQLGDRQIALSGRYREEGQSNAGATAAAYFAVGILSGFIKGKSGFIPKGRELKARTGEAMTFTPGISNSLPPAPTPADTAEMAPAPATEPAAPIANEHDLNEGGRS